jgi:hypothetical protein
MNERSEVYRCTRHGQSHLIPPRFESGRGTVRLMLLSLLCPLKACGLYGKVLKFHSNNDRALINLSKTKSNELQSQWPYHSCSSRDTSFKANHVFNWTTSYIASGGDLATSWLLPKLSLNKQLHSWHLNKHTHLIKVILDQGGNASSRS